MPELPNSFLKRRLQIPPGNDSNFWFFWLDHIDSTYGTLLALLLVFKLPLHLIINGVWLTPLIFIVATWMRKRIGVKI